jgi:hypothetical protein
MVANLPFDDTASYTFPFDATKKMQMNKMFMNFLLTGKSFLLFKSCGRHYNEFHQTACYPACNGCFEKKLANRSATAFGFVCSIA